MRTPFMAGNWKMNKTIAEAVEFAKAVKGPLAGIDDVEMGICAPFVMLPALAEHLGEHPVKVGAQNMYWEEAGAYTGEISPLMLKSLAQLVILGHSERREYFGETDETVNRKTKAALEHDLTPIVCVGENLEQNKAGETQEFVSGQVRQSLAGLNHEDILKVTIAYEPIWAIGTGLAATPEQANDTIGNVVRATLAEVYNDDIAQQVRILYGGSVKPANCEDLMKQPEIDGGLVGGASLKPESFIELVQITQRVKA